MAATLKNVTAQRMLKFSFLSQKIVLVPVQCILLQVMKHSVF